MAENGETQSKKAIHQKNDHFIYHVSIRLPYTAVSWQLCSPSILNLSFLPIDILCMGW